MKLYCPTLGIENEEASLGKLEYALRNLPGKEDPFLILEKSEMTYMQAEYLEKGYKLEYQIKTVEEHYRSCNEISIEEAITAFRGYFSKLDLWKHELEFEKIEIQSKFYKFGVLLGKVYWTIHAIFKRT